MADIITAVKMTDAYYISVHTVIICVLLHTNNGYEILSKSIKSNQLKTDL